MTVAEDVIEDVEDVADTFADIVYADAEWVDLEFDEIVAGLEEPPGSAVTQSQPRPRDTDRSGVAGCNRRPADCREGARRPRSSIRSPPLEERGERPGQSSVTKHPTAGTARTQKGESHHVHVI